MSTSNKRVFDKFLALIESRKLCSLLTDQDMTILLNTFLSESRSVYFKNCKVDLSDYETYDFFTQTFTASGSQNVFTISQYPSTPNSESMSYTCTVNGTDAPYTFNDTTLQFTLSSTPTVGQSVICGYDFIGQFNNDIDEESQWILAHGMIITWTSGNIMTDNILRDMVVTVDFTTPHSPANLLDKLVELRQQSLKEIRQLTVSYSFNGFAGFN